MCVCQSAGLYRADGRCTKHAAGAQRTARRSAGGGRALWPGPCVPVELFCNFFQYMGELPGGSLGRLGPQRTQTKIAARSQKRGQGLPTTCEACICIHKILPEAGLVGSGVAEPLHERRVTLTHPPNKIRPRPNQGREDTIHRCVASHRRSTACSPHNLKVGCAGWGGRPSAPGYGAPGWDRYQGVP